MFGNAAGTTEVDDDFAARGLRNFGAWILGRNMFGSIRGPWANTDWKGWWGHNFPLTIYSTEILLIRRVAGVLMIIGGVLLAFSGLGIFRAAHTTTAPFETPVQRITRGPYRFTRNLMYVGLTLIYLGVAGTQVQIWPVLVLPLLLLYLQRVVIPIEEARLRAVFGDAYGQYCAKVRRWI